MKKISISVMTLIMSLTFGQQQSVASTSVISATTTIPKPSKAAQTEILVQRLNAIHEMNISEMSSNDKIKLRNEVNSIKKELKTAGVGVYLSGGALIIVIILLIILL